MKLPRVLTAAALAALCLLPSFGTAQSPTLRPVTPPTPAQQPPTTPVFRPAAPAETVNLGGTPAEVFGKLAADPWIPRSITFQELGFTEPVVLGYPDTIREIYLPVPAGVDLSNAQLQLDASYVRADGGRTTLVYAIDGAPVTAQGYTADRGDASAVIPIDGKPRPSGFVRLNIDWRTAMARENTCADARAAGNILRIEPTSKFVFRYNGTAIRDLAAAWSALPAQPTILIASNRLTQESYDSAWRVGVALERAGKRPKIRTLPVAGDTVNMQGVAVPPGLKSVPGYAGLTDSPTHKIASPAEAGALMAMGPAGPIQADIVIADANTAAAMGQPLDALQGQVQGDAAGNFTQWRQRALDAFSKPAVPNEIRLANVMGRPTIVVASNAGAQAAGLFTQIWQQAAAGTNLVVSAADEPKNDASAVSLKYLGGKPASFDVLAHADWNASFDIGSVAADGKGPGTLVIDVAASPSAARTPPVVSVFMNEVLLGAKEMEAHGKRERIVAPVPRYALQTRNTIRVSFVRQLASDRCRETPEPYPVSVLASSHMLLDKIEPAGDFTGLMSKFANGGTLYVPAAHLNDATTTLPRVIRLAASTGLSPVKAKFVPVADGQQPKADGAYLAVDVVPQGVGDGVKPEQDRLFLAGTKDRPLLDVRGLNRVGMLEVHGKGDNLGAVYRTLGAQPPSMEKPIMLSGGNLAIMGNAGLRTEVNTRDPSGQGTMKEAQLGLFERGYWWTLPILAVALFVALLVFASRMRRRKSETGDR
ncbi:hypothetical protein FN976_09550 [Caenimonas sedimenti]|uniref:Cyclic di-GMP-binding protein n=1 Tax=Caenimonas sedimenti TaxID=2596921 RepID=A0A562ZSP6_9BURK|nr:hypothetical protein [Caenimonas sedimenti]TWO71609.1 hypothetical protein FN976_09550 [Caenimonas sedimenti]